MSYGGYEKTEWVSVVCKVCRGSYLTTDWLANHSDDRECRDCERERWDVRRKARKKELDPVLKRLSVETKRVLRLDSKRIEELYKDC